MVASGEVGILPESKAVFPFMRRMETLVISLLQVSPSSSPECRASAMVNFFNSLMALSSQPPKDSNLSLLLLLLTHHKCTCTPFLLNVVPLFLAG